MIAALILTDFSGSLDLMRAPRREKIPSLVATVSAPLLAIGALVSVKRSRSVRVVTLAFASVEIPSAATMLFVLALIAASALDAPPRYDGMGLTALATTGADSCDDGRVAEAVVGLLATLVMVGV